MDGKKLVIIASLVGVVLILASSLVYWRIHQSKTVDSSLRGEVGTDENGSVIKEKRSARKEGTQRSGNVSRPIQNNVADDLATLPSNKIVSRLLNAIVTQDNKTLNKATEELINRGQQGDQEAVAEIQKAVENTVPARQQHLVWILGKIATPPALDVLLDIGESDDARLKDVRLEALEEIAKIGRYVPKQDEKELRGELSTILEHELPNAIHDDRLLPGVAGGLATVGTAQGVESLLKALDAGLQEQDVEIIANALREVRDVDAVTPLSSRLEQDPQLKGRASKVSGDALTAMSRPEATDALLRWAANIEGADLRDQAFVWFAQVQTEPSLNVLKEAGLRYKFRDGEMLKGIQVIVRKIESE